MSFPNTKIVLIGLAAFAFLLVAHTHAASTLNGTTQYFSIAGDFFDVLDTSTVTIEAWIKGTGSTFDILTKRQSGGSFLGYTYGVGVINGNNLGLRLIAASGGTDDYRCEMTASTASTTDGKWHHIAMSYSGDDTSCGSVKFYVDGISRTVTSLDTVLTASNDVTAQANIGAEREGSTFASGSIEEVRFWSYVRTADMIKGNMFLHILPETGLQGLYRLDEGIGRYADDLGIKNANATATTAPVWSDSQINYKQ
jgi:hypothetical protein